ncbi:MAG: hypothetical protein M3290_01345 [Actinomycetota bacterium]|nr:hypothetical protein [Actinomycetota bacterium]
MTHDELAGYAVLAGYGVLLVGVVRVFGIRKLVFGVLAVLALGVTVAFASLKAVSTQR